MEQGELPPRLWLHGSRDDDFDRGGQDTRCPTPLALPPPLPPISVDSINARTPSMHKQAAMASLSAAQLRAALLLQVLAALLGVAYAFIIPAHGPAAAAASARRGVCARAGAVVRLMADGAGGEVRGAGCRVTGRACLNELGGGCSVALDPRRPTDRCNITCPYMHKAGPRTAAGGAGGGDGVPGRRGGASGGQAGGRLPGLLDAGWAVVCAYTAPV